MSNPRGGRGAGDRGRGGHTPNSNRGRGRSNGGAAQNNERHGRGRGGQDGNANALAANATSASDTTPIAPTDYKKRLGRIKAARPQIRQQFVQDGLMNPEGQMRLSDSVKLYGLCTDMCPEFERVRRIVEEDVKMPECTPETQHLPRKQRIADESRMVKAYARSAAGMDVELVSEIRSPATCLKTLEYLFRRLDHDDFQFLHQWVWDRTRAVRKDLSTQRIEAKPDIRVLLTCLEQSARFYMLAAHHMGRSTKEDYSHQHDVEQLNQTLISLKERYADNRRAAIPSDNEAEFWAYRLILAPLYANTQLENELHSLPSHLRNNPRVKTALDIFRVLKSLIILNYTSFVQCQSNWKKFWDLIKSPRVSYLMACAAAISFNRVRHVVLDAVWRSFRIGNSQHQITVEDWTPEKLKYVLGLDTDTEAVKFCEDYGFVFELNKDGNTFMDIKQKGYEKVVLPKGDVKPQFFSASIVESKRYGRTLSAVIQGLTVQEAKTRGLLLENVAGTQAGGITDETSLFVPETSTPNTSIFGQTNGTTPTGMCTKSTTSPFQLGGTPTAVPNPFLKAASQNSFGGTQPGVFDPSKNPIVFAPSGDSKANPFLQHKNVAPTQSASPATPVNPFLQFKSATLSQSTTPTAPENPFLKGAAAAPAPKSAQHTATTTPQPSSAFSFSGLSSNAAQSPASSQAGLSFTPTGPPPQAEPALQEAEKQKAEQQRRDAAEKQRKEDEARQRVQEVQRARQAQEEERRRQAEAEAAQQRERQQEQADRERRAREEQEQVVREAQQRQAQEEEARAALIREKDSALHSLTADIMFHPDEGLLMQFIENAAMNIAKEAAKEVRMERKVAYADAKYQEYLVSLKRAGLAKIVIYVEKKKRMKRARERRKRLKQQRAEMASKEEEDLVDAPAPPAPIPAKSKAKTTATATTTHQSSVNSSSQRSVAPPSARRAKRTEERRGYQVALQNGGTGNSERSNDSGPKAASEQNSTAPLRVSMINGNDLLAAYSQTYQQAVTTAPIDRTETDWFRLRAMGIDPRKHRKRSFDSTSSDEEEQQQTEPKRPKLLPPAKESYESPPPMTIEAQQRARLEAIRQAFKKSVASPSQSINGATSVNGRSSLDGSSSNIIAKAQKLAAESRMSQSGMPPPQHVNGISVNGTSSFNGNTSHLIARAKDLVAQKDAAPNVQHDWSRSVPNLGFSASSSQQSTYGNSFGTASTKDRPAYWERTSRFVPRHLYGQGAEAVRAYFAEHPRYSPASTRPVSVEPQAVLSPIPTQQSYIPPPQGQWQGYTREEYSEEEDTSDIDLVGAAAEDENAVVSVEEEEYEEVVERQQYNDEEPRPQFLDRQYSQQQYGEVLQHPDEDEDEDEDSEMADGDDEALESDEEASGSYDGDTEEEEEGTHQFAQQVQPVQQQFGRPATQGWGQAAPQQPRAHPAPPQQQFSNGDGMKPGATEDDAIELSD
ncbi:hypothetical protein EJ02DRAFT_450008 [Clathrospora elynae]|uniref:SAC3/GANP/THP3 conserved domain-containing protein n=1 Tax=Clathrospora elynae TaxID=706981 RepID=A0A6A5T4M9_9PLEO|nr:hypothetical protein EJ02DRAFT_450008 [Clathrospora elynae]